MKDYCNTDMEGTRYLCRMEMEQTNAVYGHGQDYCTTACRVRKTARWSIRAISHDWRLEVLGMYVQHSTAHQDTFDA